MTFAPLWIVNVKGATPTMLGILSTLSSASAILLQVPAGRLADNIGRKKTFFIFTAFYCLGIITLILAPSPKYLMLASILGMGLGGIGGAALTPLMTMWWEGFPTENRGKVYGLEGIITASSRIPTMILGGILWDQGFKAQILLAPVLTELLIVLPLLYTVPETFKKAQ
jgi:MFS family permease